MVHTILLIGETGTELSGSLWEQETAIASAASGTSAAHIILFIYYDLFLSLLYSLSALTLSMMTLTRENISPPSV